MTTYAYLNECYFHAAAGGLADFRPASAVDGYFTPAQCTNPAVVDGNIYAWRAESASLQEHELFIGAYSAIGPTISRTTILQSSNGGAKVDFSAAPRVRQVLAVQAAGVPDGAIQFNNGTFSGDANLTWTPGTGLNVLGNPAILASSTANSDDSAFDITTASTTGGPYLTRWKTNLGGATHWTPYINDAGGFYSRQELVISGTYNPVPDSRGVEEISAPTGPLMIGIWADVFGPALAVRAVTPDEFTLGGRLISGMDAAGNFVWSVENDGTLGWGAGDRDDQDTWLSRGAAATLQFGGPDAFAPVAQTIAFQNVVEPTLVVMTQAVPSGTNIIYDDAPLPNSVHVGQTVRDVTNPSYIPGGTTITAIAADRKSATLSANVTNTISAFADIISIESPNVSGVDSYIIASRGTGTGVGGTLHFQTAPAGTSGTSLNAAVDCLTVDAAGVVNFLDKLVGGNYPGFGSTPGTGSGHAAFGNMALIDEEIFFPPSGTIFPSPAPITINDYQSSAAWDPNTFIYSIIAAQGITHTGSSTLGGVFGQEFDTQINSDSTGDITLVQGYAANLHQRGSGDVAGMVGMGFSVHQYGTGTLNTMDGFGIDLRHNGTNTIGTVSGFNSILRVDNGGDVTSSVSLYKTSAALSAASVVANYTGYLANAPTLAGGASITTNCFGVDIKNHAGLGGSKSYNLYSEGATSINVLEGTSVLGQLLATTATYGYPYVATCAGIPTGTPTAHTGTEPIVINTTNNTLHYHSGSAWWQAGFEIVTASRTYYVDPTGSDSNDGLTALTPFATIQHAVDVVMQTLNQQLFGFTDLITIQLADGTYDENLVLGPYVGYSGATIGVYLRGNTADPTAVVIQPTATKFSVIEHVGAGVWNIAYLTVDATAGGTHRCVYTAKGAWAYYSGCNFVFSGTTDTVFEIDDDSTVFLASFGNTGEPVTDTNIDVTGTVLSIFKVQSGGCLQALQTAFTINITGSPEFSEGFIQADGGRVYLYNGVEIDDGGTSTGPRLALSDGSDVSIPRYDIEDLPGDDNGTIDISSKYNASIGGVINVNNAGLVAVNRTGHTDANGNVSFYVQGATNTDQFAVTDGTDEFAFFIGSSQVQLGTVTDAPFMFFTGNAGGGGGFVQFYNGGMSVGHSARADGPPGCIWFHSGSGGTSDGMLWFDGTNLKLRTGGATKTVVVV